MIEAMRHLEVFDPEKFGARRIDIVGCGALGSRVALSLAKLGIGNIHAWDFDTVEIHNIPNQAFGMEHIGKLKVEALRDLILQETGTKLNIYNEKVNGQGLFGEVVILLPDTMASRKEIWEKSVKLKPMIKLLIEARMGADNGRVYAVSPCSPRHIKEYESTFYKDEETETSACGASTSVGPTAEVLSGLIVWQLIRWFDWLNGGEDIGENEIVFSLRSPLFLAKRFDS